MPPLIIGFILSILCLLSGSHAQIQELSFGQVYNLTFDADYMYFQVFIPYNPVVPTQLRTAILTYVPYETLNVSASFTYAYPNSTNRDYYGTDKDGNLMRGVVWIDNIPQNDTILYISVSKFSLSDPVNIYGLNIEWPVSILDFPKSARYETQVTVQPWQTKWFLLNFDDSEQYVSAVRAEFCDETLFPVAFSIVFPEITDHSDSEVINPCACTDVFIEQREKNILSTFNYNAVQMFILPSTVTTDPVYGGIFYAGESGVPNLQAMPLSNAQRACNTRKPRALHQANTRRTRTVPDEFTVRLSLYGQELYPSMPTKYTKPDKVNDDLIANVDDTPYCDFWSSDNFTGYFSPYQFYSIDAACFLETHSDEFQIIDFEPLVGGGGEDEAERVLIIHDYYRDNQNTNTTYFNIVHSNEACGSYAYFNAKVPKKGWEEEIEKKDEWTPLAIILTVVFGFLFAVFFIATILLVSRLREFSRYNKIPH